MTSISILKAQFDALPFSESNIALYELLLTLDISDFKPVIEEILSGRITIEDTRQLFANNVASLWNSNSIKVLDARATDNISATIKNNLIARIVGNSNDIVKENLMYPDNTDLKYQIAAQFKADYGIDLPKEDIERLLPLVEVELYSELSLNNKGNATLDKDHQIYISNALSYKTSTEI